MVGTVTYDAASNVVTALGGASGTMEETPKLQDITAPASTVKQWVNSLRGQRIW
jgi:hypothetical protein